MLARPRRGCGRISRLFDSCSAMTMTAVTGCRFPRRLEPFQSGLLAVLACACTFALATRSAGAQDCDLTGYRVFVDPGHGGSDSGAVGPTGLLEKDVTLD